MDFSAIAINQVYNLVDDDSDAYRALFQDTDYQMIMTFLTRRRGVWKRHPFTSKVTTFQMKALKPVLKVWYNFIYATLKPNLHLSTIIRDKTILLYAIVQSIKFDVRNVIERGIIESTHGRCTGALIYPSLITQLCQLVEVPMHESEEKSTHRLPMSLLKTKHRDVVDIEVKEVTEEQVKEELGDDTEVDEAPQDHQQMRMQFERLTIY